MSIQYDQYLINHKNNVTKGFEWLKENLPYLIEGKANDEWQFIYNHDASKTEKDEYEAYDTYFYGGNKSFAVVDAFNIAWLMHIHRNPHHWQYWVLIEDDPNSENKYIPMEMPYNYIVEMICDWWSFSWASGNLYEIFNWYEEHQETMILNDYTRFKVKHILRILKAKLDSNDHES